MSHRLVWLSVFLGVLASRAAGGEMPWVRVAEDKKGFVLSTSGKPFVPWGFNYDHDEKGRLARGLLGRRSGRRSRRTSAR